MDGRAQEQGGVMDRIVRKPWPVLQGTKVRLYGVKQQDDDCVLTPRLLAGLGGCLEGLREPAAGGVDSGGEVVQGFR